MFCPNCGNEIKEGMFCPKCGTKLAQIQEDVSSTAANVTQTTEQANVEQPSIAPVQPGATQNGKNSSKISPKTIGIIAVAAIALLVVIIAIANKKPTINLSKYVSVEFTGYDTLGKATAVIDWDSIEDKYGKKLKLNTKQIQKYAKEELGEDLYDLSDLYFAELMDVSPIDLLESSVYVSVDKSSELSNGDSVICTCNLDEEEYKLLGKMLNCNLNFEDKEFTAEGLEEAGTFNPFDGLEITYSGIAPEGSASIENSLSSKYGYSLSYSLDKSEGLSNGDTIKVTADIGGNESYFIENYGVLPSPTEQTYTVEGLLSYIDKNEDIPDQLLADMQSQAEDVINAYIAQKWDDEVTLKALTYLGNYLLVAKDSDSWGAYNKCVLVYKITSEENMDTRDDGNVIENRDIYYHVTFSDLMLEEDGTGAVDLTSYDTPQNSYHVDTGYHKADGYWNYEWYYVGYEDLDDLYSVVVTQNLEDYTHEDNVIE